MASESRAPTSDLEAELKAGAAGFDFFQALRLVECANPREPLLGKARRPNDEALRLGQDPHLAFPSSSLAAFTPTTAERPARLAVLFMGLFGPMGPLPLHLTQHALQSEGRTFAAFCDIFHHRILCLFYRAWADARPHVQQDRPHTSRYDLYLGALCGHGLPSQRLVRDASLHATKLRHAGLLAGRTRRPDQLASLLRNFFELSVTIEEFVGGWLFIPPPLRSRLGPGNSGGRLGWNAVVGVRSFQRQQRFRIRAGPVDFERFEHLLPNRSRLGRLSALVQLVVGNELEWDLNLVLEAEEVPDARLDGGTALGWTSWLTTGRRTRAADDLVLDPVALAR